MTIAMSLVRVIDLRGLYKTARDTEGHFQGLRNTFQITSTGTPSTGIRSFPLKILSCYLILSQARIPIKGGLEDGVKPW